MKIRLISNIIKWRIWTPISSNPILIVLIWILSFPCTMTGGGSIVEDNDRGHTVPAPYIEPPLQVNVTVALGQTAFLRCPVKFLGDKTVSWMRRRDLHILTSGNHIFTSDPRVSLLRDRGSWTLKIQNVQRKDDSPYECQINTEPKMRLAIFLTIIGSQNDEYVAPPLEAQVDYRLRGKSGGEARVLGKPNMKVIAGGTLELTCVAAYSDSGQVGSGSGLTWFRDQTPIKPRLFGGLDIQTTRAGTTTISKLKVSRIEMSDSGKYSCGGTGLQSESSILVMVIQGHGQGHGNPSGEYDFDPAKDVVFVGGNGPLEGSPSAHSGTLESPRQVSLKSPVVLVAMVGCVFQKLLR